MDVPCTHIHTRTHATHTTYNGSSDSEVDTLPLSLSHSGHVRTCYSRAEDGDEWKEAE